MKPLWLLLIPRQQSNVHSQGSDEAAVGRIGNPSGFSPGRITNPSYTLRIFVVAVVMALLPDPVVGAERPLVRVGSKKDTESVILGEMACHLIRDAGGRAEHRAELGGTQFLWKALLAGEIDLYPEYTGTLQSDIVPGATDLHKALAAQGVRMSRSLGFSDSYGLGMKAEAARRLDISRISDLRGHPELRYGFSEEFRNRADGWGPLRDRYGLKVPASRISVLDHDLAYKGLDKGHIDVIDVYTTEGKVESYGVVVLEDDRHFFPAYDAVWVYRDDLPDRLSPAMFSALLRLEGRISAEEMIRMNALAEKKRRSEPVIAARFLRRTFGLAVRVEEEDLFHYLLRLTKEHLFLVGVSLGAAVLLAVPLGIVAARNQAVGQAILGVVGVMQTIPSLALLVFLIPLLGIGAVPAIAALFIYSLLPIVRNTYTGLHDIPPQLRESAAALGLSASAVLWLVELPLASRSILAGIKTAAVINIGTATLGALISAGGYGQPIFSGIRTGDNILVLEGAIPAALLALLAQGLFELAERRLVPRGLRLRPE
jgi:osmoprotectant transport system substrate-binding protein/osmoprotectant transport system permease protein